MPALLDAPPALPEPTTARRRPGVSLRRPLRLFLASALVALATGQLAEAMDPRLPVLTEEPTAETKVAQFERASREQPAILAALKAAQKAPARDRIHRALLAIPSYAAAVAGFEKDGDNVEAWQELLASDAASSHYLQAHATYFLGRALLARDDLGGAAEALENVRGRLRSGTPWTDEATLYLGYVYARLPELGGRHAVADRARAQRALSSLVANERGPALYPKSPERVREGATWMLRELAGEGMGPLLELAKRMETIERMLHRTATGKGTQKRQEKVISEIDRLIALMREKEKP